MVLFCWNAGNHILNINYLLSFELYCNLKACLLGTDRCCHVTTNKRTKRKRKEKRALGVDTKWTQTKVLNNLHKSCISAEKKKKLKMKVHDTYPYTKTTPIQHYMATERNFTPLSKLAFVNVRRERRQAEQRGTSS